MVKIILLIFLLVLGGCFSKTDFENFVSGPTTLSVSSSMPISPSDSLNPLLFGNLPRNHYVRFFSDSNCRNPIGEGSSRTFSQNGIQVSVSSNSTTRIFGIVENDQQVPSGCIDSRFSYRHDPVNGVASVLDVSAELDGYYNSGRIINLAINFSRPVFVTGSPRLLLNSNSSSSGIYSSGSGASRLIFSYTVASSDNSGDLDYISTSSLQLNGGSIKDATGRDAIIDLPSPGSAFSLAGTSDVVVDTIIPTVPIFISWLPSGPANNNFPLLTASSENGTVNSVYFTNNCTGPKQDFSSSELASGVQISVADNSITQLFIQSSDLSGNATSCTVLGTAYTEDSVAPSAPSGVTILPSAVANNNTPTVKGVIESGATVAISLSNTCSSPIGSTDSATFALTGLSTSVADNSVTSFYGQVTDGAGNSSSCALLVTYTEDSAAPSAPSGVTILPSAVANNNTPTVKGVIESGATVAISSNSSCSPVIASRDSASFASTGASFSVADNSVTSFYGQVTDGAGNSSSCALLVTYTEDSAAPSAPSGVTILPSAVANNNTPTVKGVIESGATVAISSNSSCSPVLASRDSVSFASTGASFSVADNSVTSFYGQVTDGAGNSSSCALLVTYTEDSAAPSAPSGVTILPSAVANNNTPTVKGVIESGATVAISLSNTCSSPIGSTDSATFALTGLSTSVADDSVTSFYGRVTDGAGNSSSCALLVTYTEDSAAPSAPILSSISPYREHYTLSPLVLGIAETGSTVSVYKTNDCSGSAIATGTSTSFSTGISIAFSSRELSALSVNARDASNNVSACSNSLTFRNRFPEIAADLNTSSDGSSSPTNFIRFDNKFFFSADDGINGSELWVSDGTFSGTTLFYDINPISGSSPSNFTIVGSLMYFSADDGEHGEELWVTDGTLVGTQLVKDIFDGSSSSDPSFFSAVGTRLIFSANNGLDGSEPWVSQGSENSTNMIKDLESGEGSSSPRSFCSLGSKVVFAATSSTDGLELHETDFTVAGTQMVTSINPGLAAGIGTEVLCFSGKAYFAGITSAAGTEPWVSDGTSSGTIQLADLTTGSTGSSPAEFINFGTRVYFAATSTADGREVFRTDGTPAGTSIAMNLSSSSASSNPINFAVSTNRLYFRANGNAGGSVGNEAYFSTNGTSFTRFDINSGAPGSNPGCFTEVNSRTVFSALTANGYEPWAVNGGSLVSLGDLWSGSNSSMSSCQSGGFATSGSQAIFRANNGSIGQELFITNGTLAGTSLVRDINSTSSSSPRNFTPVVFASSSGAAFLARASNGKDGIFFLDSLTGTTSLIVYPIDLGLSSVVLTGSIGNRLIFTATSAANGNEIWSSDGTSAGTSILRDIFSGTTSSSPQNFVLYNSMLFFVATDSTNGREIFRTNGTTAGTVLAISTRAGASSSSPSALRAVGSMLYYLAYASSTFGYELYRFNGSSTTRISDFNPDSGNGGVTEIVPLGTNIITNCTTPSGSEICRSDGTLAGSVLVRDINTSGNSSPKNLVSGGSFVIFNAFLPSTGFEPWVTDGTAGGTFLLADICPGATSSLASNFTVIGSKIIFSANDCGATGNELWESDGTVAGTKIVSDINPGSPSSSPSVFTSSLTGEVYFTATESTVGRNLYRTNGTGAGTYEVGQIAPASNARISSSIELNGTLFFGADNGSSGVELWKY